MDGETVKMLRIFHKTAF